MGARDQSAHAGNQNPRASVRLECKFSESRRDQPRLHQLCRRPGCGLCRVRISAELGNSNYSSLQISAERRARDVTYLLSYTYAKSSASSGDAALTNIGLDYPNQVAPLHKLNPRAAGHNFFNTSAFASNLSCGFEVCGVTGSAKQFLFDGPGTINTDMGVEKMFNVFNHANFTDVIGNANSSQFAQSTNTASARIGQISGKFIF